MRSRETPVPPVSLLLVLLLIGIMAKLGVFFRTSIFV